jgi:hypothetical protein
MDSIKEAIASRQRASQFLEATKRLGESHVSATDASERNVGKCFAQLQSDASAETMNKFSKQFADAMQQTRDALERVELLAQRGWTLPMEMSLPEFYALVMSDDLTLESIEGRFLDYYTRDCGTQFIKLKDELLNSDHLVFWKPLLEQVFDDLSRDHFAVCVPSLLSILEGAIAIPWKVAFQTKKERQKFFQRRIDGAQAGDFNYFLWKSIAVFVENVFEEGVKPGRKHVPPKRNLILHGKSNPATWNRGDCLRLLQALLSLELLRGVRSTA